jgi:predicted SAM-dependent methyltransferase
VAAIQRQAAALIRRHRAFPPIRAAVRARRRLPALVQRRANAALYRDFLAREPRRLHLGAGPNLIPGWLNTDLDARPRQGLAALDARKPFPLPDACCDVVFCEHLIEHLTYADGQRCLHECRRVLRPNSVLRVATPDLRRIVGLALGRDEWYLEDAVPYVRGNFGDVPPLAGFVVNNFFRDWGHQFIYDAETLRYALEAAGFTEVQQREPTESDVPDLRGVEHHGDVIGERMNRFETLVLEARR